MTPLLGVEADGLTFVVPTWDHAVGQKLFVHQRRKEMKALKRAVNLLDARGFDGRCVFVDVGANIGTTALTAIREGYERVVAIEPEPGNVRLLRANAILSGMDDRIEIVQAVASSEPGSLRLKVSAGNSGAHRVASRGIEVEAVTLDSLLAGREIGMVWIDTQGHEHEVLAGAANHVGNVPFVIELALRHIDEAEALLAQFGEALDLHTGQPLNTIRGQAGRYLDVLLIPG